MPIGRPSDCRPAVLQNRNSNCSERIGNCSAMTKAMLPPFNMSDCPATSSESGQIRSFPARVIRRRAVKLSHTQ